MKKIPADLAQLASSYGIEADYEDTTGEIKRASVEQILAILELLGATGASVENASRLNAQFVEHRARRAIEPVLVSWEGSSGPLRWPAHKASMTQLEVTLTREDGSGRALQACRSDSSHGKAQWSLSLPDDLPSGYHKLRVRVEGREDEALLIRAPSVAYRAENLDRWTGLFVPLYATHSMNRSVGSFSELERLARWAGTSGCKVLATLPMLAGFYDALHEDSPYRPASRLMWNELFVDARRVEGSIEHHEPDAGGETMDYAALAREQRARLQPAADAAWRTPVLRQQLQTWAAAHPHATDYARFRATTQALGTPWPAWPSALRSGHIEETSFQPKDMRYHLFAQWVAERQIREASERAATRGVAFYLDLPLGTHPDGFDTWHEQDLFVHGASLGAPPDPLATEGQCWSLPPVHPLRSREQGHRHWIALVRHQMRVAGVLRIDHVMGLYRQFWIPNSHSADDGVYVRFPMDELLAILLLESHRHRCELVGEDLGTVPAPVREAMKRHGLLRCYVLPFETTDDEKGPIHPPDPDAVATLNTHDMPTFAGFAAGHDIDLLESMSWIDAGSAIASRTGRRERLELIERWVRTLSYVEDDTPVFDALTAWLARQQARGLLLTLEDLWNELRPQNVPGTGPEMRNWRRKMARSIESVTDDKNLQERLRTLVRARQSEQP